MATILINNIHDLINLTKDSGLWGEDCVQMADIDMSPTNLSPSIDIWDAEITYAYGDFVTFEDDGTWKTYAAKNIGGNINKSPDTEDTYWLECWATDEGWIPIGLSDPYFTGSYDGGGYTISNIYCNRTSIDFVGTFNARALSHVHDVHLYNVDITGHDYVGGISGYHSASALLGNCSVSGVVRGNERVGGAVGQTANSVISHVYFDGQVYGVASNVGGICGIHSSGIIEYCYSYGSVEGNSSYVGGLVGNLGSVVNNSFSSSSVSAEVGTAGGFAGLLTGNANNCYSDGNVVSGSFGGGFV